MLRRVATPTALIAAFALLILSSSPAEAVAPTNDNFGSAANLNIGAYDYQVTTDATFEALEPTPGCGLGVGKTVWYKHTAADTNTLTVDTYGSDFDTGVQIYRAPDSSPTFSEIVPVACDDDSGGTPGVNDSLVSWTPLAGATYYIQVTGFGGLSGSLITRLGHLQPNENVGQAATVSPPFSATFNTGLGTDEEFELVPCGVGRAVWFRATLPAGSYVVRNTSVAQDAALAVYFGPANGQTISNLNLWDCNDDDPSGGTVNSRVNLVTTFDATWYFQVGGLGGTAGDYTFSLGVIPDLDGDGVVDQYDNCPNTANGPLQSALVGIGNQNDADVDGIMGTQPPFGAAWGGDACDADDDNDGIPDTSDASCRTTPEDYDGFEDGDGCPDTDNDGDGICDAGLVSGSCTGSDIGRYLWQNPLGGTVDCRNVAEDYDSFHDTDGCPEPDNDYDNFPDGTDDCPGTDYLAGPDGIADFGGDEPVLYLTPYQAREDFDGVIDWDGCHDSPNDDYDGDGLGDETEVFTLGTDPVNPDTDADTVIDGTDNCPSWPNTPQNLPPWPVPAGDGDCDGFNLAREQFVGTDPAKHCNNTTATNDEPDYWPTDFNDSRFTSNADLILMGPSYNKISPDPAYNKRYDLNANGSVTNSDVILFGPFYNKGCG